MVRSTNIWLIAALNLYGCTVHGEIAVTTKNIALAPSSRRLQQYRLSITPVSLMSTFPLLAHDPVSPNSYTIKAMQFIRAGAEDEDVVTPPNSKAKSGEQSSSASGDNPPPHLLPFRRRRYSFIGGTVIPLLRKIFANQGGGNYGAGWRNMMEVFDWVDVLIVFIWGYAIEPALFFIYSIINTRMKSARAYSESATSKTGKVVSHAGRIACLTYIVELAAEFIEGFVDHTLHIIDGVDLNDDFFRKCPQMFAAILYSHWIAKSLNRYKRNALYDFLSNATHVNKRGNTMTNQLALFPLYDRCLQAVIYFFAVAVVLDITKISVGALLQSVFKFSGVSVFGLFLLAMKGPAEQVLSGIILLGSGKMTVGEKLLLSSGDEGKIEAVGWMETTIRYSSNLAMQISNSDLLQERYANISRTPRSRLKFDLRFQHEDIGRITDICQAIKGEIDASCPKLIRDGSKPVRVSWIDVGDDHIKVVINTSYEIKPSTGEYWENREVVLLAVARAMQKMNVRFALPREDSRSIDNAIDNDGPFKWV